MRRRKPKQRTYRKMDPNFASDYIKTLRVLSRKHKSGDAEDVGGALRVLRRMSQESFLAGRGELWIPQPHRFTGHYPIMEKIPYTAVRRAIRKNTSEVGRARAWGVVSSSTEPFVPLFSRRPGSLNEAQRRRLLAHALVSLPVTRGRHPALLGKKVPGQLGLSDMGTRSVISIRRMAPEDWEKGFTMRKFSRVLPNSCLVPMYTLSEDISKSLKRTLNRKPVVRCPSPHPPKVDLKETLKKATETGVKLEPERCEYKKMRVLRPGLGKPKTALEKRMAQQMDEMGRCYTLSDIDQMCYEDGVREWVKRTGRRAKRAWLRTRRWIRRDVVPTALRGATLGVAELAQTEVGMGPTTIDLMPVERVGLKRSLQPYPSNQLRGVVQSLQENLVREVDPVLRKGLEKGVSEIATELMIRKAML